MRGFEWTPSQSLWAEGGAKSFYRECWGPGIRRKGNVGWAADPTNVHFTQLPSFVVKIMFDRNSKHSFVYLLTYLFHYSCMENPRDREAWWATVHGVAKSQA